MKFESLLNKNQIIASNAGQIGYPITDNIALDLLYTLKNEWSWEGLCHNDVAIYDRA